MTFPAPAGVSLVQVETAREMLTSVKSALPADLFIAAAAVADWRVAGESNQKIKKGATGTPSFTLAENPDILATVSKSADKRPKIVIGFAAETEKVIEHAQAKLAPPPRSGGAPPTPSIWSHQKMPPPGGKCRRTRYPPASSRILPHC